VSRPVQLTATIGARPNDFNDFDLFGSWGNGPQLHDGKIVRNVGPGTDPVLGFTHYWARSRKGTLVVSARQRAPASPER
jgi:hypothetical protein